MKMRMFQARTEHTRTIQEATKQARRTCDAKNLSIALENSLKSVLADKEEASAKRDEWRHRDKEEKMQSFTDIERNTLEVQQRKLDLAKVKRMGKGQGN
jgi:hypothetical protein